MEIRVRIKKNLLFEFAGRRVSFKFFSESAISMCLKKTQPVSFLVHFLLNQKMNRKSSEILKTLIKIYTSSPAITPFI